MPFQKKCFATRVDLDFLGEQATVCIGLEKQSPKYWSEIYWLQNFEFFNQNQFTNSYNNKIYVDCVFATKTNL